MYIKDLAKKIGLSKNVISALRNGNYNAEVSFDTILKICNLFKISPNYFVNNKSKIKIDNTVFEVDLTISEILKLPYIQIKQYIYIILYRYIND